MLAKMAGTPAFGAPLQQIDKMQSVGECEDASQRTQKAAKGPLREEADHKQRTRVKHIRPWAGKMRRDDGVERLHLRDARAHINGERSEDEDDRRRNILSKPQVVLH